MYSYPHMFANVYFFDKAALNSKTKSFTSYFSLHCNEIMNFLSRLHVRLFILVIARAPPLPLTEKLESVPA